MAKATCSSSCSARSRWEPNPYVPPSIGRAVPLGLADGPDEGGVFGEEYGKEGAGFLGADAAVAKGVLQLSEGAGAEEELEEGEAR